MVWPLYVKLELRAITKSQRMRDSAVMISSTMPSAKYSCSGSPLILANGNTAIDGLSGRGGFPSPASRLWRSAPSPAMRGRGDPGAIAAGVGEGGAYPVDADRPCDVLELLRTDILKNEVELARDILLHAGRDANPAGLGQAF